MLSKQELKEIYFEVKESHPHLFQIEDETKLIIRTWQELTDIYQLTKDEAKDIALCIQYDYAFLYR